MAALAADTPRIYGVAPRDEKLPATVAVADIIYIGAVLTWDTTNGGVEPSPGGALSFAGFALDNKVILGTETLGDVILNVRRKGKVILAVVGTVALTHIGATVYAATNDNTFTLSSTGNMAIGKITRVVTIGTVGVNEVEVEFEGTGFTSV